MPPAKREGPVLDRRAPAPVVAHCAPLVLPVCAEPIRDGAVVTRGDRVLQVGSRAELLSCFPVSREVRWTGMIVAGLVDACAGTAPPGPGVTARASVVADPAEPARLPGISYVEVRSSCEREWEEHERDALIMAIREVDRPRPVGIAARTPDPQVLEDVAVLARTFGLRLLVDLDRHSTATLDEAGALGPHCHATCARPLDPGERKLLRLRGTVVAVCPPDALDLLTLIEDGNPVALGGGHGDVLGLAAAGRERARELGTRPRGLDRRLVEAATLGGARALGMDRGPGRVGSLGPGSRADFAVFDARGRYPYAALLTRPPCLATIVGGTITNPPPT
jgi:hypothetical protein